MSWLTDGLLQIKFSPLPVTDYVPQKSYKICWSKDYSMIHVIVLKMSLWFIGYTSGVFFLWNSLRNFYLITDVQARTCDYCFHVKWEVSWTSSLPKYRAKSVEMEGKGQLNWQLAQLDMFKKNENEPLRSPCYKLWCDSTFFFVCVYFFFISTIIYYDRRGGQGYSKWEIK